MVFVGLILLGASQFGSLIDWLLPAGDSWWAVLASGVLWVFFAVAAGFVVLFTFTIVANLIGAPFNGLLSERVERSLARQAHSSADSVVSWFATVAETLRNELRKLSYFLVAMLLLLLATVIPLVNIVAPFAWVIITAWLLALEYLAYPMESHGLRFCDVRQAARNNRLLTLGFGVAVMLATLVPVVNLAVMPASVAGATAMWIENRDKLLSEAV